MLQVTSTANEDARVGFLESPLGNLLPTCIRSTHDMQCTVPSGFSSPWPDESGPKTSDREPRRDGNIPVNPTKQEEEQEEAEEQGEGEGKGWLHDVLEGEPWGSC